MTAEQWRDLLDERFGPLREVEREARPLSSRRLAARRRRALAEGLQPVGA